MMTATSKALAVAYSDEYQRWQLGAGHPTNPVRARLAHYLLQRELGSNLFTVDPAATAADRELVESIHDPQYVAQVLDYGISGEWKDARPDLGATALTMFAGTARLVDAILQDKARVAFNPQGAKHHAQYDYSSGFCVFGDMPYAATAFMAAGMRVMYVDWDVHHGDGVEDMLLGTRAVTCSVHEAGIFPGTGLESRPEFGAYNWALPAESDGDAFVDALADIRDLADDVKPDVVLLAAGADAHEGDPLGSLRYNFADYKVGAGVIAGIARKYAQGRVLIGGAGGYQPYGATPVIWAQVVSDIYKLVGGNEHVEAALRIEPGQEVRHPAHLYAERLTRRR